MLIFFLCTIITPSSFADTGSADDNQETDMVVGQSYVVPLSVVNSSGSSQVTNVGFATTIDRSALVVKNSDGSYTVTIRCYGWNLVEKAKVYNQQKDSGSGLLNKIGNDWGLSDEATDHVSASIDATFNGVYQDVTVLEQTAEEKAQGLARLQFTITNPEKRIGFMAVLSVPRGTYTTAAYYMTSNTFLMLNMSSKVTLGELYSALENGTICWEEGYYTTSTKKEVNSASQPISISANNGSTDYTAGAPARRVFDDTSSAQKKQMEAGR